LTLLAGKLEYLILLRKNSGIAALGFGNNFFRAPLQQLTEFEATANLQLRDISFASNRSNRANNFWNFFTASYRNTMPVLACGKQQ